MFKFLKKRVLAALIIPMLIIVVIFSPLFVKAANGEIDIFQQIAGLFSRVENQDAKIDDLETEIAKLREELATQITQNKDLVIPHETVETPEPEKNEETQPTPKPEPTPDPKPAEPSDPASDLKLQVSVFDDYLKLAWTKETDATLQGYKVVISQYNAHPSYPDEGYLKWITDYRTTTLKIDNSIAYNGGDFGKYLKPDTKYYFSITYVYKDKKVTTDPVRITTPSSLGAPASATDLAPDLLKLQVETVDDHLTLSWTKEPSSNLQGYKVVISKNHTSPAYPDDGYLKWITDHATTTIDVDNSTTYNGGDIDGYLQPSTDYYFSITYVYADKKVTTPAVKATTPASMDPHTGVPPLPVESLKLQVDIVEDHLKLSWTEEPSPSLQGYKVVISQNNSTPAYPDDGYLKWITDPSSTTLDVNNSSMYNGGDFGGFLLPDTEYYFSITYVYDGAKVTTDAVRIKTPLDFPITK